MKSKIIFFIAGATYFSLTGCVKPIKTSVNEEKTEVSQSDQQKKLVDLLNSYRIKTRNANKLEEIELMEEFDSTLVAYIDSIKVFQKWEGQIYDIRPEVMGNKTNITFTIRFQPDKYRTIGLNSFYLVDNNKKKIDKVYNLLKNFSNGDTIYIDGLIYKKSKKEIFYNCSTTDKNKKLWDPKYNFITLDIKNKSF